MSVLTDLTRMWLTRTVRPFTFRNEFDQVLPYSDCEKLGLYIHIPFCKSICAFCPYCKVRYDKVLCDQYIDALIREIHMVGSQYPGKKEVTSLYFGGGTPALAADRLPQILAAVQEHFIINDGIGLELHPDNVIPETLFKLKQAGVTRISIGIQSFQPKFQRILGRTHVDAAALASALQEVPFDTVSMDFIFALPGQEIGDLKADIDTAFSAGANHIAIYPFIDFTFTGSTVPAMKKEEKRRLLDQVTAHCESLDLQRNSIWTFAKSEKNEYSSMTRENFLGFGCSATTLLRNQFKINTFDVGQYCDRIDSGSLPTSLTTRFTLHQRMIYYLFWAAYSTRVDSRDFEAFFGRSLKREYGFELWLAKRLGFAREKDGVYQMTGKGAFYYHYYENFYTLAYIDKMWGIMRQEAFPEGIEL